jgi:hypothetical protein
MRTPPEAVVDMNLFKIDRAEKDLHHHEKLLELLDTYHRVYIEIPTDQFGDMLTWCLKHCQGKFRDLKHGDGVAWYFEKEKDATLFALRWT